MKSNNFIHQIIEDTSIYLTNNFTATEMSSAVYMGLSVMPILRRLVSLKAIMVGNVRWLSCCLNHSGIRHGVNRTFSECRSPIDLEPL